MAGKRVRARPTFVPRRRGTFHDVAGSRVPSSDLKTATGHVALWGGRGFDEPWLRSLILHLPDSTPTPSCDGKAYCVHFP
eukprot:5555807-Prymnesium_polylepis.1